MISNRDIVNMFREAYPADSRVKLIKMDDPYPVPAGTLGTVKFVDDACQIHVQWDNGSTLALVKGKDKFMRVTQ